jgi:hypothetical protein
MKSFLLIIVFLLGLLIQDEGSVEMYRVEKEDYIELHAKNSNLFPVTVELNLELEHLKPSRKLPVIDYLPANQNKKMLDLTFTDIEKGWNMRSMYRFYMGSIFAKHKDSFAYQLPFPKGETYKIDQGFGGAFSHQGDLRHSYRN